MSVIEYIGERPDGAYPGKWYLVKAKGKRVLIFDKPNGQCYLYMIPKGTRLRFSGHGENKGSLLNTGLNGEIVNDSLAAQVKALELLGVTTTTVVNQEDGNETIRHVIPQSTRCVPF